MTTFIAVFLLAFVVSTAVTPAASRLAHRFGALARPGASSLHEAVTPKLGGLAVAAGFVAGLAFAMGVSPVVARNLPAAFRGLALGASIVLLTGVVDDVRGLPGAATWPLLLLAALVATAGGVRFELITNALNLVGLPAQSYRLDVGLSYGCTVAWLLGITYALRLIDGLDALASGLAFIVSTSLLVVAMHLGQPFYAAVYAALMGAVFGFGRFNKYPAKIFLGRSGATFLGFLLAGTAVLANHKSTALGGLLIPVVALGVPVADMFYALTRRAVDGKNPLVFQDRSHIHHRLLEKGYTPKQTVWILYLISIGLSAGVFLLVHAKNDFAALIILLLTAGSFTTARKLDLLRADRFPPPPEPGAARPDPAPAAAPGRAPNPGGAELDRTPPAP